MTNTTDGAPRYAVLAAAVLGIMGSYAMLRDWDRFGPRLLAHPSLMAVDLTFGAVLLLTASPASPLAYATVCTPLLAGLLYGWRGSGVFTGLQLVVLLTGPGHTAPAPARAPSSSPASASAPASSASPCAI
jgi:hypothetical protein